MAHTLKLVGTTEWHDPWTDESDEVEPATVAMLTPEELRSLIAAIVAEHDRPELPQAA
jgi:hypothetical protein